MYTLGIWYILYKYCNLNHLILLSFFKCVNMLSLSLDCRKGKNCRSWEDCRKDCRSWENSWKDCRTDSSGLICMRAGACMLYLHFVGLNLCMYLHLFCLVCVGGSVDVLFMCGKIHSVLTFWLFCSCFGICYMRYLACVGGLLNVLVMCGWIHSLFTFCFNSFFGEFVCMHLKLVWVGQ